MTDTTIAGAPGAVDPTSTFDGSMLAAALAHAARGRPVFPCGHGKKPLTEHGFKDASTSAEIISAWWAKWPDALIGMPTGKVSGVFAVDIDQDEAKGKDGEATFATLCNGHGPLPDTVESMTPRGGRHILFRHPGGDTVIPNSASKLGRDVDVRGDGGYIILPPSRLPDGRQYAWEGSSDPNDGVRAAAAPEWLLAQVVAHQSTQDPPAAQAEATGTQIPEGQRNATLASLAGTMRRAGMSETAIRAALHAENSARCQPPLYREEVDAISVSVSRYAAREHDQRQGSRSVPGEARGLTEWLSENLQDTAAERHHRIFVLEPAPPPVLIEGLIPCDVFGLVGPGGIVEVHVCSLDDDSNHLMLGHFPASRVSPRAVPLHQRRGPDGCHELQDSPALRRYALGPRPQGDGRKGFAHRRLDGTPAPLRGSRQDRQPRNHAMG